MSNATQDSRNSGDNRRRRSRGGRNRNNNNRREGDRDNRESGGHRVGHQAPRAEEFRPQSDRQDRQPRKPAPPPKLTLWQKILKAIGLYKEPVRPPRPPRKPDVAPQQDGSPKVKSNTRIARSGEGDAPVQGRRREGEREDRRERGERPERQERGERAERGERPERGERGERGDRSKGRGGERARGGDRDSVESARVYVGNLSYDVSESDLQDLFKGVGGVRNVEIVYNRSTHRSKGYGFVEMLHVDEAKRAVEVLNDQFFMGRKLLVSGAKSKGQDEREDREERPERQPRPAPVVAEGAPVVAAVAAPVAIEAVETISQPVEIETIVEQETAPEVVAAVHNVEAVGAPEVIVEAVEHQVTAAVEGEPEEEKQA